jgi:hypothetical protein
MSSIATRNYALSLAYREELVDLQIFVAPTIFCFHIVDVNRTRMHQKLLDSKKTKMKMTEIRVFT